MGRFPIAPGTMGSVGGLVVVLVLRPYSPTLQLLAVLAVLALGWYCADRMERTSSRKDNPQIVIDEIVGMMISAWAIPSGWGPLVLAFLIFRILDVVKPPPAGWIDRKMPGGAGVMLDDVVAGVYSNLILQGLGKVLHW